MNLKQNLLKRLTGFFMLAGLTLFLTACNKTELEELEAQNLELQQQLESSNTAIEELQAQLNLSNSSISDLETKKDELEAQQLEADADIATLNEMIEKLEGMIASRYAERYLSTIFGAENHFSSSWEHLYNEDMELSLSKYSSTISWVFNTSAMLNGETAQIIQNEIKHNYLQGVLTSSEYPSGKLLWEYKDGSIAKITQHFTNTPNDSRVYLINTASGLITNSAYYKGDIISDSTAYAYNEQNLITKVEAYANNALDSEESYAYNENNYLINYSLNTATGFTENLDWKYNANGLLLEYVRTTLTDIDSVAINYNQDGSWEVIAKEYSSPNQLTTHDIRHFNAEGIIIYTYSVDEDDEPLEVIYEFTNGNLTKENIYGYEKYNGDYYKSSSETFTNTFGSTGQIQDQIIETIYYDKYGGILIGYLNAKTNIVWANSGEYMKSFTAEGYNFTTKELTNVSDYIKGKTASGITYTQYQAKYQVTAGVASYIYYTIEYTEYFEEAHKAPKVKVTSSLNSNGDVTGTNTYINDINSSDPGDWVWVGVAN